MEIAILALGCFWGPEVKFSKLDGVLKTEVGYCGGNSSETNYKEVCTGSTNHAEVVKLEFDPELISYEKIINFFYEIHDPTTLNSQGPDFGTQYRSEIFYLNEQQKQIAEKITNDKNKKFLSKIVTKISLVKNYCPAEEYHQKYLEKR
ncbi:peptide-methionine (S)-S-oxide reductase MsrA [Candidatus Pelagibacter sp.]|jgi:methionine-S-sulfoxide reductase|nr:peptide-methionine (S)-S-oxide reductase MsrA [Candidatus Pelagibacter bacterium]MDC0397214.1 peptide-methionine (S)-S-oxide reductase MsrA [Candidatus Pelagibacter sp.]MDC0900690.1 peptide-methionine (S)-S-oxide reductase MsrA [Candidatus Pelagibacter sp.]MDC1069740.1 peptide-methionine (S)-S-oxide reductase MsrA [Candidatus Pelagibacter sp.]